MSDFPGFYGRYVADMRPHRSAQKLQFFSKIGSFTIETLLERPIFMAHMRTYVAGSCAQKLAFFSSLQYKVY